MTRHISCIMFPAAGMGQQSYLSIRSCSLCALCIGLWLVITTLSLSVINHLDITVKPACLLFNIFIPMHPLSPTSFVLVPIQVVYICVLERSAPPLPPRRAGYPLAALHRRRRGLAAAPAPANRLQAWWRRREYSTPSTHTHTHYTLSLSLRSDTTVDTYIQPAS